MNNSFYYTLQRVLSFNALINIIIGERGIGKSYTREVAFLRNGQLALLVCQANQFTGIAEYCSCHNRHAINSVNYTLLRRHLAARKAHRCDETQEIFEFIHINR